MKGKSRKSPRQKGSYKDMLDEYNISPWYSLGKTIPTSNKPKQDVFDSFRPSSKQCVDYKISETWTKMQRGDLKVNVKQTCATYVDLPLAICKPPHKKQKLFSGGPPQWKFIDEIWREHVEEMQTIHKAEYKKERRENKRTEKAKFDREHAIIQRLVGPEWFMELSPKQLRAIDELQQAVSCDIRKQTTINCEEIMAILGLVLRPNKKHIRIALKHSCGSAVEFLLVLYQILDPKRQNYSLNDRLLLSSVVHLTITPTLKELHVRIPSPPKEPKKQRVKKEEKKNNKKYGSPYLVPLTFQPPSPKFSGIYTNKHKQYPENPYFSYIESLKQELEFHQHLLDIFLSCTSEDALDKKKEYATAQAFYESLPGVKHNMLSLLPPSTQELCINMLNPYQHPPVKENLIAPHLCKVSASEPVLCFCEESYKKGEVKRSRCEKCAQKFLDSLCFCDDCIENVRQKNLIRIHGGVQRSICKCEVPIPIIQGTMQSRVCNCYKEYRDRIVICAAQQRIIDQELKFVVGGVVSTKFGPVYNVLAVRGKKICLCNEIRKRKIHLKELKETLIENEAKFVIGGIVMTKFGPVYSLTSVVARKPCKCILKYRKDLEILNLQNQIRNHPVSFVNNGLVISKLGPIFYISCVLSNANPKEEWELRTILSSEIKKSNCLEDCMKYLEYEISHHKPSSSSSSELSACISGVCASSESESESDESSSSEEQSTCCPYCCKNQLQKSSKPTPKQPSRCKKSSSSETNDTETTSSEDSSEETTASLCLQSTSESDYFKPKPCRCKDELDRFMNSKCPCEECNRKIRQSYATYVMGDTKVTPSGNQIRVVQGIQQPLCSCMQDHLKNIKQIDEYKSRVKARYNLKKQPKKYCISGVKYTEQGPIYIISGMRPPIECECGKVLREKQEKEAHEKIRAILPNTGRIKYEIAGVKAMPDDRNIYIMGRALNISPCDCENLLQTFEMAHEGCMDQFKKYLEQTQDEIKEYERDMGIDGELQEFADRPTEPFEMEEEDEETVEPLMEIIPQEDQLDNEPNEETNDQDTKEAAIEPIVTSDEQGEIKTTCCNREDKSDTEDESSSEDEFSSSSESYSNDSSTVSSSCGSCHIDIPPGVRPITLQSEKVLPDSFLSKRFAIFRNMPKSKKTMFEILRHILEGMAEDGYPLAKLPEVYKLPIFKLWIEMRLGIFWTYDDRRTYHAASKYYWKHTNKCYKHPPLTKMPYTVEEGRKMTWRDAKCIKRIAAEESNTFYRKVKQVTVDTAREFFATTCPYEFPTYTWRDCAFAYLPTKEEDTFPYKIIRPHEARNIPSDKKFNCYC